MAMQRIANPWISVRLRDPPPLFENTSCSARVVELVDTRDLKSLAGNSVPVQVRPRAPFLNASQLFFKYQRICFYTERFKCINDVIIERLWSTNIESITFTTDMARQKVFINMAI